MCNGVQCVDLGESFQTHIFLRNFASIQPRTSPVKFAPKQRSAAQVTQPDRNTLNDVECYVPGDDRFPPCYDELVVKEEKQVLPIAVIHIGEPGV